MGEWAQAIQDAVEERDRLRSAHNILATKYGKLEDEVRKLRLQLEAAENIHTEIRRDLAVARHKLELAEQESKGWHHAYEVMLQRWVEMRIWLRTMEDNAVVGVTTVRSQMGELAQRYR